MHHDAHFVAVTVEDKIILTDQSSVLIYDSVEELARALPAIHECTSCAPRGMCRKG